jgi:two-component system sensor histidine kinase/response regulator
MRGEEPSRPGGRSKGSLSELRKRAEQKAKETKGAAVEPASHDEAIALLQELRVHQIQLEMQHEQLKRSQADLEEARARYFDLYHLAPVGYLTVADTGFIVESNLHAATLFGATNSALSGSTFSKLVAPGDEGIYFQTRKLVFECGSRQLCELRLRRARGDSFWARLEMSLSQYGASPVSRIVVIDISERKMAEERFDAFMEHSPASSSIADEQGRYLYVNPALRQHTGRGAEDWIGKTFFEVWSAPVARRLQLRHEETLATGHVTTENEWLELGQQQRVYQVLRFPFAGPNGGKLVGSVSVDVTERQRLEMALRETNRLLAAEKKTAEEATNAKSNFLSAMSHEIRTPLNGVVGMAGLLLQTELTGEQLSYARIVADSGDALLSLVNDILDFSKIEAGKLTLDAAPFDLEALIDDVLGLMSFKAHEKSLELVASYPAGAPRRFLGDASRIRQVLMNYLSNAIKFTQAGHVLIEVAASEPENGLSSVRMTISDTGIGIPAQKMAHLFNRFAQADPSIASQFGGSGLGLSIVKQIVELMGGEVGVKSDPGKGSSFYCQIPLVVDQEKSTVALDDRYLVGMNALVTGGQFVGRAVLAEWCRCWGMNVEGCELPNLSGALAAAAQKGEPFQFVIVDGGRAALTEAILSVRLSGGRTRPKLVLLSIGPWEQAKDLVADAVLSAPLPANRLRAKLIDLIREDPTELVLPPDSPPATAAALDIGARRVLVADDNRTNQRLACALLRKLGCDVDTADGGIEAVKKAAENDYGLVFMDCVMPDMDGFAATMAIRALAGKFGHVPVVALTASATNENRDHCFAVGMNDFLTKPIRSEQLSGCLVKWLKQTD